ncbi:hypothetical protein FACS1894133_3630 [Clostridia bacterium]|nr:hypothetical protein FACS1894133_3630 [Clostridia bacterium]
MGLEYIKKIAVKPDGVYLNTKSNNDSIPFRWVKIDSLTNIFEKEGQKGLDREIVNMLYNYAAIRGDDRSVERYKPCFSQAAKQIREDFSEWRNSQAAELSSAELDSIRRGQPETEKARAYVKNAGEREAAVYERIAGLAYPVDANLRYHAYDFLIGSPVLIDREAKTLSLYRNNLNGQIYNLKKPDITVVDTKMISGLIRRTANENYGFSNSKVIDGFLYAHLMTTEQQERCRRKPEISKQSPKITATDDFTKAVKAMCEWVYDYEYSDNGKNAPDRATTLEYCRDYIADQKAISKINSPLLARIDENKKKAVCAVGADTHKTAERGVIAMSKQTDADTIKVNITKDDRRINSWVIGEVKGIAKSEIRFNAKVFDEGSVYGINNGRVSKLDIRIDGKIAVNYDRGWDVKPQTPEVTTIYKRVMAACNALNKVVEADLDKPKDLLGKIEGNKQKVGNQKPPAKQEKAKGEELC